MLSVAFPATFPMPQVLRCLWGWGLPVLEHALFLWLSLDPASSGSPLHLQLWFQGAHLTPHHRLWAPVIPKL